MISSPTSELRQRLYSQALTLIERATDEGDAVLTEALLEACSFLEASAQGDASIVAVEREVDTNTGSYHLAVRRLKTSVPVGKFQIIITRQLASGLIH